MLDTRRTLEPVQPLLLDRPGLDDVLAVLRARGYATVGPVARDGAIVLDEITSTADLPVGITEHQDGGTYRLAARDDEALFGFSVGPHSAKGTLLPPRLRVMRAHRDESGAVTVETGPGEEAAAPVALIGLRSCDLHAIAIQDRVLTGGTHSDTDYAARRRSLFVLAVNCGQAGGTCFCVSMRTGPKATEGFDLALTELCDGEHHRFVVEVGSAEGAAVMAEVPHDTAGDTDLAAAAAAVERAAGQMGRTMDADAVPALLAANLEHPRWEEVADRCLACGNCTAVCPTCFCTTVEDVTDLGGQDAERTRTWDSCFNLDFSYVHGGTVRSSGTSRYRQWMTHKLSTWVDQFGSSGCVGCGRCITWCPVAIDITEEVAAIHEGHQ